MGLWLWAEHMCGVGVLWPLLCCWVRVRWGKGSDWGWEMLWLGWGRGDLGWELGLLLPRSQSWSCSECSVALGALCWRFLQPWQCSMWVGRLLCVPEPTCVCHTNAKGLHELH